MDFTETETRVYVKVENTSSLTFDAYVDQGVIVQKGKQYENQYNYLYGDISTSIKPGASTEGVIAFERVEESGFTYSFIGYDDNFNELEFKFDVTIE